MEDDLLLLYLEELALSLEIQVRHEALDDEIAFCSGGLCRIKGKNVLIVNRRAATAEKVKAVGKALKRFDLSGVYIKPAVREFLDSGED